MSLDDDNDKAANSKSSAPYSALLDSQLTNVKKKPVKQLPGLQTPYARLSKTSTCEEVRPLNPPLLNQRPQQDLRQKHRLPPIDDRLACSWGMPPVHATRAARDRDPSAEAPRTAETVCLEA
jgi:hypothetical protein